MAWINDWAPHQGSVDELMTRVCNKALISFGRTPLQSEKGCDMLPLVPGRSCERGRKGALKAQIPCVGCRA
jgi:hypothetical protein